MLQFRMTTVSNKREFKGYTYYKQTKIIMPKQYVVRRIIKGGGRRKNEKQNIYRP